MGVRYLTTFINLNSHLYLQNYYLHNTFLVIDGNSIAVQLYIKGVKCNNCFGGDYDKYADYVSKFFDDLLKCNVTPLVIIDGGKEKKKFSTIYIRMKDKIKTAAIETPERQSRTKVFPLFMMDVFKHIVRQKDIRLSQSLYEADSHIASVAQILNCPVLSSDSDFFIFDVMYIPFQTLYYGTIRKGDIFVKSCKMYKLKYFLDSYPGMDKMLMPVAAIVLGNDYIDKIIFKHFLSTLKIKKKNSKRFNENRQQVDAVFTWLQTETLDSAIKTILSKVNSESRENVLEVMEMILNGYFHVSPIMLEPLGFSNTFITLHHTACTKCYKIQCEDILNILKQKNILNLTKCFCEPLTKNESSLYKLLPSWFIKEFISGNLPSYFINLITEQLYMTSVQVEDFSQPTCVNISLKIIAIIFSLLQSNIIKDSCTLKFIARGKNINIASYELVYENFSFDSLCSFSELQDLSLKKRKEILNETLGVTDTLLDAFPPEWKLYLSALKFWVHEASEEFRTKFHVYSLLFTMLYHVVDKNIGFFCRKQINLEKKYSDVRSNVSQKRKMKLNLVPNMSIHDALNNVSKEDCVLAMPFFINNFIINKLLVKNAKHFSVSVVHAFSLFQNCLKHVMNLNALLNYPYQNPNVANLFNGTLLYNLYNKFKYYPDLDMYVATILKNSPTLLQLFTSISVAAQSLFSVKFDSQIKFKKRVKRRKRHNNSICKADNLIDEEDLQCYISYSDVNNKFSLLSICNID